MDINANKLLDEADLLIGLGQYDQAIEKYNFIIENASDCDEAFLMRGALLGEMGQLDKAIADIENSIRLYDKDDSAYTTLALLYEAKNKEDKAIELCRKSISLNSNNTTAINLIVKLCTKLGDKFLSENINEKAEDFYRKAFEFKNKDAVLLYKLALVSCNRGMMDNSIHFAKNAIAIDPNHIRAKAHLAFTYEIKGDMENYSQLVESLNCEYPEHPMVNIVYAQYALRTNQQQKGIHVLEKMIQKDGNQKPDLISAEMLLGNLYDSIQKYEIAFTHYKQFNDLKYDNYNHQSYTNYISELIHYFTKEKYSSLTCSENTSNKLIFIVGMPRSGTSLIEQIISSHSNVHGAGELTHVFNLVDNMPLEEFSSTYPTCLDSANTSIMNKLADKLLSKYKKEDAGSLRVTDKLPHNYHHIALLYKLFPNAKFINCKRDPRDTCLSCYFQNFAGYHPYTSSLKALGLHYIDYQRLMKHWTDELKIPVLTINYEDVVSDVKSATEKILGHLDLAWEDNCMNFYKQQRVVTTASYNQVNKKIYSGSVGRWRNYKKNIPELLNALNMNESCAVPDL